MDIFKKLLRLMFFKTIFNKKNVWKWQPQLGFGQKLLALRSFESIWVVNQFTKLKNTLKKFQKKDFQKGLWYATSGPPFCTFSLYKLYTWFFELQETQEEIRNYGIFSFIFMLRKYV
jgi:hypothetical protein